MVLSTNTLIMGLWGVSGILGGLFVWKAMTPPQAIGWQSSIPWFERALAGMDRRLRARWNPKTQRQAEILSIPSWRVLGLYGMAAAGGGLVGFDLGHHIWLSLILAALAAWKGPAWMIGKQFQSRQKSLMRDFPPLVLMLRIYLDLGEPLAEALSHTRPALSRIGQGELNRLLSALQMGVRQAGLKTWAKRTGLTNYLLLADTLSQGWDQGLDADALMPLDTLIKSSREQGTRTLTDRLDGMATIVPVIAAFGVMSVLLYALLVGSGIG